MKRLLFISSLVLFLSAISLESANAQLITDSDRKLRTEKREKRRGLGLFKKNKGRSASGVRDQGSKAGPPQTSVSPFSSIRKKSVTPRYTPVDRMSLFRSKQTAPRFSDAGGPASVFSKQKEAQPRYSPSSSFAGNKRGSVSPRSDSGSPFTKKDKLVSPRFSSGSSYSRKDKSVMPRFSPKSPFKNNRMAVNPRTSLGSPFSNKDIKVQPRYSPGSPFGNKRIVANPRTSGGSPFEGVRWSKADIRYSDAKHRFDVDERYKRQTRIYDLRVAKYKGEYKRDRNWYSDAKNLLQSWRTRCFKGEKVPYITREDYKSRSKDHTSYEGDYKEKWVSKRTMHPSFNHHTANQDMKFLRDYMRNWNIFWTRINGNKTQPDAVKDKISKPKFDRKETDIWND